MSNDNAMDPKAEDIKKLEEQDKILSDWQDSLKQAQEVAPFVQNSREIIGWRKRALKDTPPEADDIPYESQREELEAGKQFFLNTFPPLIVPATHVALRSVAVTTSGSTSTTDYITRVSYIPTPGTLQYANTHMAEYQEIQKKQGRVDEVRALLIQFNEPNLFDRFDRAYKAYMAYAGKTGEKTAASNEMRNLLYGLRGHLYNRAKKTKQERPDWKQMAPRLAINGGGGIEHILLSNQYTVNDSLATQLADPLKDREGQSITDIDAIWIQILDHFYTVFTLIKM